MAESPAGSLRRNRDQLRAQRSYEYQYRTPTTILLSTKNELINSSVYLIYI